MARYITCILLLVLLAACGVQPAAQPPMPAGKAVIASTSRLLDTGSGLPEAGQPAPDFEYTPDGGSSIKLSDLRGKRVVLNFWATWCGPCREEMPDLQDALLRYGDNLVVLGVNKNEHISSIRAFADEMQVTFPLIADPDGAIPSRYRVTNLPISYFINSDGTIAARHIGVMSREVIRQNIDQLR